MAASDYVSFVYVYGETLNASDLQTITAALAVPEPSAFGLLAVLGALAFVASSHRRRR